MTSIKVPYGHGFLTAEVADDIPVTILRQPEIIDKGRKTETEIIERALAEPIGSAPLAELARGKKKVVIVTSDHTRPVPSRLTLPPLLREIRRAEPEAQITILIAVGSHRATTREEMVEKFGADVVASERFINHDPHDPSILTRLDPLPSGGELWLNRMALEADLLVADGFIEPHQFAGFSGGRKSIMPGIAGLQTVLASHNAEFTVHPQARSGNLEGNPFQTDMLNAARQAGLAFILNVALDAEKKVSAAFAGDFEAAHLAGCRYVTNRCAVTASPAHVVITSNGGYPLDQNVYQSTKSIMAADLTCAEGGVIIAVNECSDGHGAEGFYQSFKNAKSLTSLLSEIESRNREETIPDQWVVQLTASIMMRRKVIMVSSAPAELIKNFGMTPVQNLEEALTLAGQMIESALTQITVLPEAVSLIIKNE